MLHYRPLADSWFLLDGSMLPPALIAVQKEGQLRIIREDIYRGIV